MISGVLWEVAAIFSAMCAAGAAAALARAGLVAVARVHRSVLDVEHEQPGTRAIPILLRLLRRTLLARVAEVSRKFFPRRARNVLTSWIRRAGDPATLSAEELLAVAALAAGVFFVCGACASIFLESFPLLGPAAAAFCGGCYPLLWLRDRIKARSSAIARALPYDLDLLTLSVEAGLDFAAALEKVVVKGRPGPLADELSMTVKELRLGTRREEALRNLSARVSMPALTTFAHALVQADRMGTPLAKVLRVLATQLRIDRTQRAEKLASEAPVKLLLPLIGCIFPTIFLMLFGPIAWEVYLGGSH